MLVRLFQLRLANYRKSWSWPGFSQRCGPACHTPQLLSGRLCCLTARTAPSAVPHSLTSCCACSLVLSPTVPFPLPRPAAPAVQPSNAAAVAVHSAARAHLLLQRAGHGYERLCRQQAPWWRRLWAGVQGLPERRPGPCGCQGAGRRRTAGQTASLLPQLSGSQERSQTGWLQGEEEFDAEVALLRELQHSHLIPLKGICREGAHRAIVTPLLTGGSLRG